MSDQQILEAEHFLPMEKLLSADPVPGQKGCVSREGSLPTAGLWAPSASTEQLVADPGLWVQFAPKCAKAGIGEGCARRDWV